ncbi:hypothetical protein CKAN_00688400 [Cinnamomum micranthum f. kanehirae]|uniref:Uncharacterized protein n=1 Tax=Cinnamomum micranthum f. kanehirae TaxID=337451 RepID=A0A443NIK1_9MAGN|nr:hypothetical protein CKAN_00688400 [Cinnamomum micranthum f. kanehirae]
MGCVLRVEGEEGEALLCWWWWCGLRVEEEGATVRGRERNEEQRDCRGGLPLRWVCAGVARWRERRGWRDREGEEVIVLRLGSGVREMDEEEEEEEEGQRQTGNSNPNLTLLFNPKPIRGFASID